MSVYAIFMIALAFLILVLAILFLQMTTLSYMLRVHTWHKTCQRVESERDARVEALLQNQTDLSTTLRNVAERHEHMSLLLVTTTNEVLSLSQERVKRLSVPPEAGLEK
jgi:hypothetical protein